MAKFGNVFFFFFFTLFKLGCLYWSVWDVAFNDDTFFFFFLGSQKVYTNLDIDLFGQQIGYRLSNIKKLSVSAKIFISVHL